MSLTTATLLFSSRNWLVPAGIACAVGLLALAWNYRSAPRGIVRWMCAVLKFIGIAALAFCLIEPLWSGERARPGANLFAVVADNSQSMQIKDRGSTFTRGQSLLALLDPQHAGWLQTIQDNFDLRRYYFDARLETAHDFGELTFDGRASAAGTALRTIAERYRNRPLAGILLFTDGNATDLGVPFDGSGLPPIYPVVIGRADALKDLAIQRVHAAATDFEDAPVSVQADVAAVGYSGESVEARLLDTSGKAAASQTIHSGKNSDVLAFRFQLRPEQPGLSFYRLNVRAKNEINSTTGSANSEEATLANNSTVVAVNRASGPYRILYVSGRPNWEYKYLNLAVQQDPQLQLVGLIRVARREPKFNFMGRAGESSNPLFRGFGNQSAEDVERYDQPVLVRLNTRDSIELRGGFPRTAEELYQYQAVILDDLEADFFTPDQAVLLQKFVSERGGGFLMLGGMECFQEGQYQHTPIGDMLPVYLDPVTDFRPGDSFRFNLTREGFLQSWARMRDNEADEKARIESMAPFQVLNRVREVKPGASIIGTASDTSGHAWPALVVQRFGRGHTAALTLGDFWHWGFHDADAHRDMDKAWRQLMRWLVNDVPNRIDLAVEPQPDSADGAVTLRVRARDPKFEPLDNASVRLEVQPVMAEGGSETNALRLQAESVEPGLYQATYVPRLTGGYKATVVVTNSAGEEVGRASAGWSTDLAAEEFKSLAPNLAWLEDIARKTGGEVIAADRLAAFARNLPHRQAPVMESWTYPVWHTPAMFGFALACLLAEWGLRRWKGMP